jgi:hypothetical protein
MRTNKSSTGWEISVPIFRDPIILRQLALAIGLPFGLVALIPIIATGGKILNIYALYAVVLTVVLFFCAFLLIMVVYGGKYAAGFTIDDQGILSYTQEKQAKCNRVINVFTVVLGLLSGKPSAIGAGLLAQSRQRVFIKWSRIRKVKSYPKSRTVLVSGGFGERIAVFCTKDNYSEVEALIKEKAKHAIKKAPGER